jgi:hypothetical protein
VCGVLKSHFRDQNAVDMLVPESGCLWVSLQVLEDWNDPALGDWWFAKAVFPPVSDLVIHDHV